MIQIILRNFDANHCFATFFHKALNLQNKCLVFAQSLLTNSTVNLSQNLFHQKVMKVKP